MKISTSSICIDSAEKSSISLAIRAGSDALSQAKCQPNDIALMINLGIYRDQNMVEPSMAALIQQKLGINPDFLHYPAEVPALSFDLMNGANGFVNVLQVLDSIFVARSISKALIVASEIHPSGQQRCDGFPYGSVGAAMVFERDKIRRLSSVFHDTRSEKVGRLSYTRFAEEGKDPRNNIWFEFDPDFDQLLADYSAEMLASYLDKNRLDLSQMVLVSSLNSLLFIAALEKTVGMDLSVQRKLYDEHGDCHSAAPMLVYDQYMKQGLLAGKSSLLIVTATSGMSVSICQYRL